uniref:HTH HARE-type domain-containing protein n=1 Tax=Amphilophus citrinellus TaxID=61819 RepID=A0A3Q0SB86_AMPCI
MSWYAEALRVPFTGTKGPSKTPPHHNPPSIKLYTWHNAVLENFSDAPMTPKQILHVIQTKGLKEMRGTAPLACLVTMLHSQVRGDRVKNSIFFKLPGRMSLFTLKVLTPNSKDILPNPLMHLLNINSQLALCIFTGYSVFASY